MRGEAGDRLVRETEEFAGRLEQRAAALSKVLKLQRRLLKEDMPDSEAIVKWLDLAAESTDGCPAMEKSRAHLLESWRRAASAAFLQLEADLREFCQSHSWRLDGQWPDFIVERGVAVQVDERNRAVTVGEFRCPATLTAIGRALQRQVSELVPKNFSPQRFVESLLRAWEAATESKGGQAPILDVYRWTVIQAQTAKFWRDAKAATFTPLSTDQFRARLSKALESGATQARGRELRLLPPLDPKDALFVHQPAEARFGYVGRIEFIPRGEAR